MFTTEFGIENANKIILLFKGDKTLKTIRDIQKTVVSGKCSIYKKEWLTAKVVTSDMHVWSGSLSKIPSELLDKTFENWEFTRASKRWMRVMIYI